MIGHLGPKGVWLNSVAHARLRILGWKAPDLTFRKVTAKENFFVFQCCLTPSFLLDPSIDFHFDLLCHANI